MPRASRTRTTGSSCTRMPRVRVHSSAARGRLTPTQGVFALLRVWVHKPRRAHAGQVLTLPTPRSRLRSAERLPSEHVMPSSHLLASSPSHGPLLIGAIAPAVASRWVAKLQTAVAHAQKAHAAKEKMQGVAGAANLTGKLKATWRKKRPKRYVAGLHAVATRTRTCTRMVVWLCMRS